MTFQKSPASPSPDETSKNWTILQQRQFNLMSPDSNAPPHSNPASPMIHHHEIEASYKEIDNQIENRKVDLEKRLNDRTQSFKK